MVRARGLAQPQAFCPLSKALPHTLPCAFMCQIHPPGWSPLPTSGESFPRVSESVLGISARVKWWASCISMCGLFSLGLGNLILMQSLIWEVTSAIFFFLIGAPETTMRLKLKEHVYKHTCVIFVILFDDKEGEYKKATQTLAGYRQRHVASLRASHCPVAGSVKAFLSWKPVGMDAWTCWSFPEEEGNGRQQ